METTPQLDSETRAPLPAAVGRLTSHNYEYERQGVATWFLLCAPRGTAGEDLWRERKTHVDYYAGLGGNQFPQAEELVLGQDNLNALAAASLYEVFKPVRACRLLERFEFLHAPSMAVG